MDMKTEELASGLRRVVLAGRLDVSGALAIDDKLARIGVAGGPVVVDLTDVSFLASIGIRSLLQTAKAVSARGGKLVIAGAQPLVHEVLESAGVTLIIPACADLAAAYALLGVAP